MRFIIIALFILSSCGKTEAKPVKLPGYSSSIMLDNSCLENENFVVAFGMAVQTWNEVLKDKFLLKINSKTINLVYCLKDHWSSKHSITAITTTAINDDITYRFFIRFNLVDFKFSLGPKFGEINLYNVMVHEIGHALGLPHIDNESCFMSKYTYDGEKIKTACKEELDMVLSLYGK